jgi:8-oxo-dGTP pyrophosphatase MutT (NUDIX family)
MMLPTPDELRGALAAHERQDLPALPGQRNNLLSGVLVPLVWDPEPVCILTLRSSTLRKHAGEVSFPGGRPDEGDRDLQHTALREAAEELGIEGARVLGELSSVPLYTSEYRLCPFVAEVPVMELTANPDEVAEVLRLSIAEVLSRPVIHAIEWQHGEQGGLSPVFEIGERRMFGATAHSFLELLEVMAPLFQRTVPERRAGRYRWSDMLGK